MVCAETSESSLYIVAQCSTIGWLHCMSESAIVIVNWILGFMLASSNFNDLIHICSVKIYVVWISDLKVTLKPFNTWRDALQISQNNKAPALKYLKSKNAINNMLPEECFACVMTSQNYIKHTIITIEAWKMNAGPREPRDESWCFTQRCARWSAEDSI